MKTKFDLYKSARDGAEAALDLVEGPGLELKIHQDFAAAGHDERDWGMFSKTYRCQHSLMRSLKTQRADSEPAPKVAARE